MSVIAASTPRIGIALGAGGARGLAHVHVIEALDDLGLAPVAVTGSSIGAIVGAGVAAGMSGADIRMVLLETFRDSGAVLGKLWQLRPKSFGDLFSGGLVQFDPETVLDLFLPAAIPDSFEALRIPFGAVATDYYGLGEIVLSHGPLRRAIAASIAMPVVFRPVEIDGVTMIDGGAFNPLPFDRLPADVDLVIACDVVGGPVRVDGRSYPGARDSIFGAAQILMHAVTAEKLRTRRPDILVRPSVDHFRVLDFLKASAILKSTAGVKDEVKRAVEAALSARASDGGSTAIAEEGA